MVNSSKNSCSVALVVSLLILSLGVLQQVYALDNQQAIDQAKARIAEHKKKLEEGEKLLAETKAKIDEVTEAQKKIVGYSQDLNQDRIKAQRRYQSNWMKMTALVIIPIATTTTSYMFMSGSAIKKLAVGILSGLAIDAVLVKFANWGGVSGTQAGQRVPRRYQNLEELPELTRLDRIRNMSDAAVEYDLLHTTNIKEKDVDANVIALHRGKMFLDQIIKAEKELNDKATELMKAKLELRKVERSILERIGQIVADMEHWDVLLNMRTTIQKSELKLPVPPTTSPTIAPLSFAAAVAKMEQAWQDLVAASIEGVAYSQNIRVAMTGAQLMVKEKAEPLRKRCVELRDAYMKLPEDDPPKREAYLRACRAYNDFNNQQWNDYNNTVGMKRTELTQREATARNEAMQFDKQVTDWFNVTLPQLDYRWSEGEIVEGPDHNVRMVWSAGQLTGSNLAQRVWSNARRFSYWARNRYAPPRFSATQYAVNEYAQWAAYASALGTGAGRAFPEIKGLNSLAMDIVIEADELAEKLDGKIPLWSYVNGSGSHIPYHNYKSAFLVFTTFKQSYEGKEASLRRDAEATQVAIRDFAALAGQANSVMKRIPSELTATEELLRAHQQVLDNFNQGSLDPWGIELRTYLSQNNMSQPGIDQINQTIASLANESEVEGYIVSARFHGGHKFDVARSAWPTLEQNDAAIKEYESRAGVVAVRRREYQADYREYEIRQQQVTQSLLALMDEMERLVPTVVGLIPPAEVIDQARRRLSLWKTVEEPIPPDVMALPFYGNQTLMDGFKAALQRYWRKLDPILAELQQGRGPEARELATLHSQFQQESPDWLSYQEPAIRMKIDQVEKSAGLLIHSARWRGHAPADGEVTLAYQRIQSDINQLWNRYYEQKKQEDETQAIEAVIGDVQSFYQRFTEAYSQQDSAAVTAMLAIEWQGSDGSGIDEVEEMLDNSYEVFDQVNFNTSGFDIRPLEPGQFEVSYTARIVGQIYEQDLVHEEVSNIVDIISVEDGEVMIQKTVSGVHWIK